MDELRRAAQELVDNIRTTGKGKSGQRVHYVRLRELEPLRAALAARSEADHDQVIERLDRPGNRADGVRSEPGAEGPDPIETFSHPYRAPVVIDGHEYRHTSDCEWLADDPSGPLDYLAAKDRSAAEHSDTRSHCPRCGEWRDSPDADCAACRYEADDPSGPIPAPYVGGHPDMPLHPFEDVGDGTCAACIRATEAELMRRFPAVIAEAERTGYEQGRHVRLAATSEADDPSEPGAEGLREALRAWLDSHGEPDIEEALAQAAKEWLGDE
jgi:hypothetical protein